MEYLAYKGSYGIAALYLGLLESSSEQSGLPAHYQLAGELKKMGEEGESDECGGRVRVMSVEGG